MNVVPTPNLFHDCGTYGEGTSAFPCTPFYFPEMILGMLLGLFAKLMSVIIVFPYRPNSVSLRLLQVEKMAPGEEWADAFIQMFYN